MAGMNQTYLPKIKELISEHSTMGDISFIKKYSKYSILIGDVESIEYYENVVANYLNEGKNRVN